MQAQNSIPNQIILLAPSIFPVECQPVMISIISHPLPFLCHLASGRNIPDSLFLISQHLGQLSISGNPYDRLYRKVCIMGQVSGKIIRTQLIFRIKSLFQQIISPNTQRLPMFTSIIRITFAQSDGSCQNQHIPTFFDRHIERICLPVGMRIGSDIMGGKRLVPSSAFAVMENRIQHSFQ